ncbi:PKD domain-containing protein [bacterium]|nr:PKD domain-containing protein [bacterium]
MNMKPARIIIVILSVIFLLAALFACGGKSRIGSLQIAPDTATPQPPAELSIDDVLADIDAAKPPPGVDPAIYNSLKEALREQLLSIYSGKIVCTPPTGPENEITDFAFESAEEDSFNFTWSYINVGDYDQDGTVGISDITPIAMFYGEPADTPDAEVVDGDGDGAIGISDITPLAIHYGNNVDHYVIRGTESEGVEPDEEIGTVPFSEGTAGSRLRFSRIYFCGTARFFRIFAVDSTGNIGAGSRIARGGPSAQADADANGRDVQFYGVGSTPLGGNVFFMWDFESDGIFDTAGGGGGGGPVTVPDPDTSPGEQSPMHTYPVEGTYVATLRVYDDAGNFSTATVTVAAYDSAPTSSPAEVNALAIDLTGAAPYTVRFLSFAEDPDGGDILLRQWDFGDGSPSASGQSAEHTYAYPGTYTVRMTVEDDETQLSTAHLTLKVCPPGYIPDMPPSAMMYPEYDYGVNVGVDFTGNGSDMDEGPVTFKWDFGDNSVPDTTRDPSYVYPGDGLFSPVLHVFDNEGLHSIARSTVSVGLLTDSAPTANVIAYITEGTQNMRVQFWGEGEDPDGTAVTYEWDFDGDGTYGDFGITSQDPIVVYTATGTYVVGMRVTDGAGDYSFASVTLVVHPCATAPEAPPPPPGDDPVVPTPNPPMGTPINARCYPCPLSIAHGPDGGTLWLIYTDNGGMDPLAAGYPSLSQIQLAGPIPFAPFLWGPLGEIGNSGNGNGGGDIVAPDPLAGPPPGDANLKGNETWEAYTITRPKDGPPRVERLDIKFHLKRADGSALATQTCIVYAHHSVGQIQEPVEDELVDGFVDLVIQVDPTGIENIFKFIDLDPGDQINVYLEVDGEVVGPLDRDADTNIWTGTWDSATVANGAHTLRGLLYDARDPQPGDPDDPGPYWETDPVNVNVDNLPPIQTEIVELNLVGVAPITVGDTVGLEVQCYNGTMDPVYDSFFDVFVEISPEFSDTMSQLPGSTHERIIQLTDAGGGLYTGSLDSEVAGVLALSVIVVDTRLPDKIANLGDVEYLEFLPGPVGDIGVCWDLVDYHGYGPIIFYGADAYANVVHNPDPAEFNIISDNPSIIPSDPELFYESDSMLITRFSATDWGLALVDIEHLPSGAVVDDISVGYPPWKMHFEPDPTNPSLPPPADMPPDLADEKRGMPAESFFDVFFDLRIPDGFPNGWQSFELELVWPTDAPITYVSHQSELGNVTLVPSLPEDDGMGWWHLNVGGGTIDLTEWFGEETVFSVRFDTLAVSDPTEYSIGLVPFSLTMQDGGGMYIYQDAMGFEGFYDFYFQIKPTKTLNMHVYRVEGAATDEEIQEDVQAAEDMFNLNALMCTLGFYVDFNLTITTIPTADWNQIDEDGDGLDRYDANGDGDYADDGDNNDLFNAMLHDYYDVSPNTENVYYVPGIRGGALGTTYWPNSQVAVDNSADPDNLTLAHEKVHEMDLRKDGDFDVKDGADMNGTKDGIQRDATAEGQGAYEPGNIMNYDDTGPLLSGTQAAELDP